ncbi:DUF4377 domain-containing protein [Candidatus Pacebacteria bacterium]|nr:DUF4377 domain-containing protein [Candidatus Paceibacterota bacterium]
MKKYIQIFVLLMILIAVVFYYHSWKREYIEEIRDTTQAVDDTTASQTQIVAKKVKEKIIGSTEEVFVIGPYLSDCVGIVPQKCLMVNGSFFYDSIKGFNHTEGYAYVLTVQKEKAFIGEVSADASEFAYTLLEIRAKHDIASTEFQLIGAWKSEGDSESIIVFEHGHTSKDMYGGDLQGIGSFELSVTPEASSFISLNRIMDGEQFRYTLVEVNETTLTLTYLPRGNTLVYTRMGEE